MGSWGSEATGQGGRAQGQCRTLRAEECLQNQRFHGDWGLEAQPWDVVWGSPEEDVST